MEGRRGSCVRESEERKNIDTSRTRPKIGETKGMTREHEPKRTSGTPRKLYRNSEPILAPDEANLPASDDIPLPGACRVKTTKEETGQMMWKSERTEIREIGQPGRVENRLGDELPIQEETKQEIDSERSRTYPKYRPGVQQDAVIEGSKTISHKIVVTDLKDPGPVAGPVLRLRLEKPAEDSKATSETSEPEVSGAAPTESDVSSKNRKEPPTKPPNETRKVYRLRGSKDEAESGEKSSKMQKDRYENSPREERKPIDSRAEMKLEEKRGYSSPETEEIIEESQGAVTVRSDYSATNRIKRTRSVTRKDEDS